MTTISSSVPAQSYTPAERAWVKAATQRFGVSTAYRVVSALSPDKIPTVESFYRWHRDPDIVPTEEDVDYWSKYENERRSRLTARLESSFEPMMEMLDESIAERDSRTLKDTAISVGILYDKMVPLLKAGPAVSFGDGANVTLNVIAPPSQTTSAPRLPSPNSEGAAEAVYRVLDEQGDE